MFKLKSVATIVEVPEQEELHVLCENGLKVLIVRGIKVLSALRLPDLFHFLTYLEAKLALEMWLAVADPDLEIKGGTKAGGGGRGRGILSKLFPKG